MIHPGSKIRKYIYILLAGLGIVTQGCSADSAKRLAFESVQNLREQECNKDLTNSCSPRQGYDEYQRKRNQALKGTDQDQTGSAKR